MKQDKEDSIQTLTQENAKLKQDYLKNCKKLNLCAKKFTKIVHLVRSLEQQLSKQKDLYEDSVSKATAKIEGLEAKLERKEDMMQELKRERDELRVYFLFSISQHFRLL